ncbi:unnamed protein product [Phyllotreta striolata]|uniref:Uncharacterized protein n=1 Tax=Phyllotreta striolata TaxID=444603 RepID=A0A9N9TFL7_PHYSR|nr:unnamed protein product [Phyllotreta striolata]
MLPAMLLLIVGASFATGVESEFTTSRTYGMDIPELDPITITEGDPLWDEKTPKRLTIGGFDQPTSPDPSITDTDDRNNEFSATALRDFLEKYAEGLRKDKIENRLNDTSSEITPTDYNDDEKKRKKNGNLLDLKQYGSPYDDKMGWVSLEPVPWSVSQISKWQSKPHPNEYSWNQQPVTNNNNWEHVDDFPSTSTVRPNNILNRYKFGQTHKNKLEIYDPDEFDQNKFTKRPFNYRRPAYSPYTSDMVLHNNVIVKDHRDIITDNNSPNFPPNHNNFNRRHGTELHSEPHSFAGDGNWVLLSTSKGYKYPKKQRSLKMVPEYINTHKSVQLTVLPPSKDSNVNMTTSHGGLLQVESTFEPVEQAQQKFSKLQKLKNKRKRPGQHKKKRKNVRRAQESAPRSTGSDSGAVIAGVGAGLIPATMAMMVPLVMNGKRRRRRSAIDETILQY